MHPSVLNFSTFLYYLTLLAGVIGSFLLSGCFLISTKKDVAPSPQTTWCAPKEALPKKGLSTCPIYQGGPLSLYGLFDLALQNNPQTRQAWEVAKGYAAGYGIAKSAYLPTGDIQVGTERLTSTYQSFDIPGLNIGGTQVVKWNQLNLSYLIFNCGAREAELESAQQALYAANFSYNQTLQDVALAVELDYFNLNEAKSSVVASLANLEDAKATLDSTEIRFEVGLADKQAVLQALASFESARFNLEATYAGVEKARAQLATAVGVPVGNAVDIIPPKPEVFTPALDETVTDLMACALQARPQLLSVYAQWKSALQTQKAATRKMLPYLVTNYSQAHYKNVDGTILPSSQNMANIVLQWDVFDLIEENYQRLQAKAKAKAAEEALKAAELAILSDVWTYFYGFKAATRQLTFAKAYVEAAQEAFEATRIGYNTGIKTITDVLQSQSTLASARLQYVSAEANVAKTLAQLTYATGRLELSSKPTSSRVYAIDD